MSSIVTPRVGRASVMLPQASAPGGHGGGRRPRGAGTRAAYPILEGDMVVRLRQTSAGPPRGGGRAGRARDPGREHAVRGRPGRGGHPHVQLSRPPSSSASTVTVDRRRRPGGRGPGGRRHARRRRRRHRADRRPTAPSRSRSRRRGAATSRRASSPTAALSAPVAARRQAGRHREPRRAHPVPEARASCSGSRRPTYRGDVVVARLSIAAAASRPSAGAASTAAPSCACRCAASTGSPCASS